MTAPAMRGGNVQDKDLRQRAQERRTPDPVMQAIAFLQASSDTRHAENVKNIQDLKTQMERILSGFPDGDPEGHCSYHQVIIDEALQRKKLWYEIRAHILKGGALALIGGVLWGAWELFIFKLTGR